MVYFKKKKESFSRKNLENPLVTRTLGNLFYLQCNSCQWTSRESGIADQPSQSSWPEFTNSMEDKLNEVLRWMKDLDENERIERSRKIQATKRFKIIYNKTFKF